MEVSVQLTILESHGDRLRAGYVCPCGCRPSVEYGRGDSVVHDGCCCGNEFAVGPDAQARLEPREGFRLEQIDFRAPWDEALRAAWLMGPSVHAEASAEAPSGATDPVCGMTVDPEPAGARALHSRYGDADYYFCGKGCKLEFDEDPERYLDPSYVPSM
jgi:YHS domain-containing protein